MVVGKDVTIRMTFGGSAVVGATPLYALWAGTNISLRCNTNSSNYVNITLMETGIKATYIYASKAGMSATVWAYNQDAISDPSTF